MGWFAEYITKPRSWRMIGIAGAGMASIPFVLERNMVALVVFVGMTIWWFCEFLWPEYRAHNQRMLEAERRFELIRKRHKEHWMNIRRELGEHRYESMLRTGRATDADRADDGGGSDE